MPGTDLVDRVADLLREASATAIEPRFRSLGAGEVAEKSAGELVTVADREAEALLTTGLESLTPGVPVVGEEAVAAEPSRLDALAADRVWLVDPLDGTANFVGGSPDWAVMVALVVGGETAASWIWQPLAERMFVAERGGGARCNGDPLRTRPRAASAGDLRGAVLTRYLDEPTRGRVQRNLSRFGTITAGRHCAGVEYPALVEGDTDFVLFWRTLPWDHAPGTLLVAEAGGVAARPDGSPYRPGPGGVGLVVAADPPTWELAVGLFDD
ncbi:MAG: hypothetical protein KDB10_20750 [Acidimicrobiales bacterium]|nr:hypothetical protein [Acidimicrobiales bacterium]MCB9373146.1 inositol monophosphatase [Microthrixaceae bacterium]